MASETGLLRRLRRVTRVVGPADPSGQAPCGVLDSKPTDSLHLADLSLSSFRGIDRLSIPQQGRVTLLPGKNGVQTTTVLDAVRIYTARGRYTVLSELLTRRDEVWPAIDDDGSDNPAPGFSALSYGRDAFRDSSIMIGPANGRSQDRLRIAASRANAELASSLVSVVPDQLADDRVRILNAVFQGHEQLIAGICAHDRMHAGDSRQFHNFLPDYPEVSAIVRKPRNDGFVLGTGCLRTPYEI